MRVVAVFALFAIAAVAAEKRTRRETLDVFDVNEKTQGFMSSVSENERKMAFLQPNIANVHPKTAFDVQKSAVDTAKSSSSDLVSKSVVESLANAAGNNNDASLKARSSAQAAAETANAQKKRLVNILARLKRVASSVSSLTDNLEDVKTKVKDDFDALDAATVVEKDMLDDKKTELAARITDLETKTASIATKFNAVVKGIEDAPSEVLAAMTQQVGVSKQTPVWRWNAFSTKHITDSWTFKDDPSLFLGIKPSEHTNGYNLDSWQPTMDQVKSFFTRKGRGGPNSNLVSECTWKTDNNNQDKRIYVFLMRVRNPTDSDISWNWQASFTSQPAVSFQVWLNGAVTYRYANHYYSQGHISFNLNMPAQKTSTIVAYVPSSWVNYNERCNVLGFRSNTFDAAARGLEWVDDLDDLTTLY